MFVLPGSVSYGVPPSGRCSKQRGSALALQTTPGAPPCFARLCSRLHPHNLLKAAGFGAFVGADVYADGAGLFAPIPPETELFRNFSNLGVCSSVRGSGYSLVSVVLLQVRNATEMCFYVSKW